MRPTHQARIESEEKALEAYRQERYQGSARVRLDCLAFENGFGRLMDDGRNALRMEQILDIQGCLRINREYHVPVLVQATDWGSHIRLLPCDTELFPELIVPLNMSLRAFGHENVIAAARKRLYGENRWWVVDVYVEDPNEQPQRQTLHSHLVRSLREHFPNRRRPPDGLIYERIRFYKGKLCHPPDEQAEALWWAVLRHDPKSKNHVYLRAVLRHDPKSKNHVYLRAFLQHPSFPAAFDALLLIPGLWAKMQLGVLHTMVSLRCDEPILSYLETISTVWMDRIFDGSNTLSVHADAETVLALESQVPKLSEPDREYLRSRVMDDRTLFPSIDDSGTRAALWERLKQIDTPIPTLATFFQDLRFLGVASKVMKDLLLPPEDLGSKKTKKITIDCELGTQHRTDASVSLRETRLQVRRGLHELWRFSFQYGLDMTKVARRQPHKRKKSCSSYPVLNCSTSIDRTALWRHFFWLADQHGFQIPAVAEFVPGQASLPTPQTPEGLGSTEQDEAVNRRCGIPYADTVDADRFALEGNRLWQPWESPQVTTVFFRRSQFQTFFRYLWDGAGINQATNAARESAATDGTAAVDQEMLNDELEHRMPSPSFSQILQISSPIDWSMAMWDCGMGSLEMPIGNLEVVVTIPNHNPRRISLPCDEMTINNFFNGLKER
ncbi:hypothetical protein CBS115989_10745 [Aspergillus niger]|nr:hypothetical protein CBS115989_10745 [Aspergillus niger]KAI2836572.1 hypothetical protein CBS11232_10151 [Aspergillus niger]KAI2869250.1 hypothetical protein CBS115988_10154 [Aspergillus niger]